MVGLPEFFKQTSDKPYDRHHYKVVGKNGEHRVFDSWDLVQSIWFQTATGFLSHIEVLDIENPKEVKSKGFK